MAAFLDMLAPTRDFSLMFVMGGALAVATPAVQLLLAKRDEPKLTKLRSGKDLQVRSITGCRREYSPPPYVGIFGLPVLKIGEGGAGHTSSK